MSEPVIDPQHNRTPEWVTNERQTRGADAAGGQPQREAPSAPRAQDAPEETPAAPGEEPGAEQD